MKTALFPFFFLEIFDQIKLTLLFMKFLVSHSSIVYVCLILDTFFFFLVFKRAVTTWFNGALIMAHCGGQPASLSLQESPGQLPTCPQLLCVLQFSAASAWQAYFCLNISSQTRPLFTVYRVLGPIITRQPSSAS